MRAPLCLLVLLPLCACATKPAAEAPGPATRAESNQVPAPAPPPTTSEQQLERARALFDKHDAAGAAAILDPLIGSGQFATLTPARQHYALSLAGSAALNIDEPRRAQDYFKRACAMAEGSLYDWAERMQAATQVHDPADAALALATAVQRWPQGLQVLQEHELLVPGMEALQEAGTDEQRYAVYTAAYRVQFAKEPYTASHWWRDLALLQLERGERREALATLSRVTDPFVIVTIEADKRFDPVRADLESRLSVDQGARRRIEIDRARVAQEPNNLEAVVELSGHLMDALQFQEALKAADAALAEAAAGADSFTDYAREYRWLLDQRSRALHQLGRWDEGLSQLEAARDLPEDGNANISQVINLAARYNVLGRPQDAAQTLKLMQGRRASGYGDMQVATETLNTALQVKDAAQVAESLGFMREHEQAAHVTYLRALVRSDHPDEAARLLIAGLGNPRKRSETLLLVQEYGSGAETPWERQTQRKWRALLARRDVADAVRRAGTSRSYRLFEDSVF